MVTDEQKAILRQQIARHQQAQQAAEHEESTLRALLIMLDPRFADPATGLTLDFATLEIREKPSGPKS